MKIACLADLHLGFTAFPALIDGRNAREVDVERAWEEAVEQIIDEDVDIVTIAGDIFHHPRVSDYAKQAFLRGVSNLVQRTSGAAVIILQGNHDAGKTANVLTPIMLAEHMDHSRLWLVTTPKRIPFRTLGVEVSVACFPYVARGNEAAYRLDPDPDADLNVLLMHAAVKGDSAEIPYFYGGDGALNIDRETGAWDVIALGDFHEFRRFGDGLAFYSGSLERTSSNIWQEHEPKGWVLVDTDAGTAELQEVSTRRMLSYNLGDFDMPPGIGADELCNVIEDLSTYEIIDDAIVRLRVDEFPREERGEIDWALVREIKKKALHFELDLRFAKAEHVSLGDRREREDGLSLAGEFAAFTEDHPADVRALMAEYMGVELPQEVPA